ncbi:MAG: hypothetical protein ACPGVU_21445 [Limisphaerales bacterium]
MTAEIQNFLTRDDRELIGAIKSGIREHIAKLQSRGDSFTGYAVMPGSEDSVPSLVVNHSSQFRVSDGDSCLVDEWPNYGYDELPAADTLLATLNRRFRELPDAEPYRRAHVMKLHESIFTALVELRPDKQLGGGDSYVVIWIPDSSCEIIHRSAKELNSPQVYETFQSECG